MGVESEWIASIVQLATAGGYGTLTWYLLVKHLPNREDRHREERLGFITAMESRDKRIETILGEYHRTIEKHIEQMAEVAHVLRDVQSELANARGTGK